MWAIKRDNFLMARLLLKNSSRVNFKDLSGRTALNFAVSLSASLDIIKLLLCFKADPLSVNNEGETLYDLYDKNVIKATNIIIIGSYMRLCIDAARR